MPYRLPPDKKALILQNKIIDGGLADDGHAIILPKNTTAKLAEMTSVEAMIAYDTTLQQMVLDSGSGYAPVGGGGGGGANPSLSNLTNPTAINQDLTFGKTAPVIEAGSEPLNIHTAGNLFLNGDTLVFLNSNNGLITGVPTIQINPVATVPCNTRYVSGDSAGSTSLRAANAMGTDITFVLPTADGLSGQAMITDGAGNLSFGSSGANTALSNLASTAINADLFFQPNPGGTRKLGITSSNDGDQPTSLLIAAGSTTHASGAAHVTIQAGDSNTANNVILLGSNVSGGGNPGGGLRITTGTGPGGRGTIVMSDGTEGTPGHIWTEGANPGEGHWAAPGSSGANTALSNLASTAINAGLVFGNGVSGVLQTADRSLVVPAPLLIKTGNANGTDGADLTIGTGSAIKSGIISISTGVGDNKSGVINISTGNCTFQDSGALTISTGNSANDVSGALNISTGTAGTTRGNINASANLFVMPKFAADPTGNLVSGGMYYNTTTNKLKFYNGTAFETVTSI